MRTHLGLMFVLSFVLMTDCMVPTVSRADYQFLGPWQFNQTGDGSYSSSDQNPPGTVLSALTVSEVLSGSPPGMSDSGSLSFSRGFLVSNQNPGYPFAFDYEISWNAHFMRTTFTDPRGHLFMILEGNGRSITLLDWDFRNIQSPGLNAHNTIIGGVQLTNGTYTLRGQIDSSVATNPAGSSLGARAELSLSFRAPMIFIVPEPGSIVLLGAGCALLIAMVSRPKSHCADRGG